MNMAQLLQQAQQLTLLRPLDVQFALMVASRDEPAVMLAAALVSRDAGAGHVCLPLCRLNPDDAPGVRRDPLWQTLFDATGNPADWRTVLLNSHAVSENEAPTPLKLVGDRLYLHRMWRYEKAVATFFREHNRAMPVDPSQVADVLHALFPAHAKIDWQKVAAAVALTRRISVISGGPGTGKTTTVARLLAALVQLNESTLRIKLAAPTGKAAARLTESLGYALASLPLSDAQKAAFPQEASTLHRLLGVTPGRQQTRHHETNPLHLDLLVVDEASMIDLPMMARLIAALPAHARVIFLGDRDQLASVEAGAVLGDICHYAHEAYTPERAKELSQLTGCNVPHSDSTAASELRDALCLLRTSYRFDSASGIGQLAQAVNASDHKGVTQAFANGFADLCLKPLNGGEDYVAMIDDATTGYARFLKGVQDNAEPADILREFSEFQLLCALREGPYGVSGLNEQLELALVRKRKITRPAHSKWYHGRPVMIARNDSALGLFNGDIGVALNRGQGLRVWFPLPDGTIKSVSPSRLPAHDTAWAMTVHKSQGSEFTHAALILPNQYAPVLTRELVYTAITRAREKLSLYGDERVLRQAVTARTERRSGLLTYFSS